MKNIYKKIIVKKKFMPKPLRQKYQLHFNKYALKKFNGKVF